MEDESKRRAKLNEVRLKLPPEGQKWLSSMDRGELNATAIRLSHVGEAAFLRCWPEYKKELQKLRHDF
jgi:hypothetical protein